MKESTQELPQPRTNGVQEAVDDNRPGVYHNDNRGGEYCWMEKLGVRGNNGKTEPKFTKAERAYNIIKQAVLKGEIEEGRFISEEELGRRHRIGRTPFREACNRLHNEQILEVVPRRGYFVQQLSFRSFGDLLEARLVLESEIVELAIQRATGAQIKELQEIVAAFQSAKASQNVPEEMIRLNTEFHVCLARMTHNTELIDLARRMLEKSERLGYIEFRRSGLPGILATQTHEPVLNAIRQRDVAAAKAAIRDDISTLLTRTVPFGTGEKRDYSSVTLPDNRRRRSRTHASKQQENS